MLNPVSIFIRTKKADLRIGLYRLLRKIQTKERHGKATQLATA